MIKPSVGRVVLYEPGSDESERDSIAHAHGKPPLALVVAVHTDRLVDLTVFDIHGRSHGRENVLLLQDDDKAPPMPHARWMGQARTETAETALAAR